MSKSAISAWFQGLIATAVTGVGNGISLAVADSLFDIFKDGTGLYKAIIATTLISVGAYLKNSPLQFDNDNPPAPQKMTPTSLSLLFIPFMLLMASCTNPTTGKVSVVTTAEKATPYLRPSGAALGVGLLVATNDPAQKVTRAKWLIAVASTLRTVSEKEPPTEAELKAALAVITPQTQNDWLQLATSLVSLYSSFRAQFGSNTNVVLAAIEQLALGLEDAAKPYVSVTTADVYNTHNDAYIPRLADTRRDTYNHRLAGTRSNTHTRRLAWVGGNTGARGAGGMSLFFAAN